MPARREHTQSIYKNRLMLMTREKSLAAFERAQKSIPGGVNSPARAFKSVGGTPLFIAKAAGAYMFDVDGNRYIDYVGSWGPMIFGHAHPDVLQSLQTIMQTGTSFGAPTEAESDLAELVIDLVPSIEMVRFVNSGTEATMSAIRVARGFTGRDVIVKFAGNYHGHVDSLLVAAGSSAATLGVPNSPGVTAGTTKDTLVLTYNHVAELQAAFAEHGSKIAGVILEPVCGNMGVATASPEFLQALRALCDQHGSVLIFDEVMCGFRVAPGGAQERFGVLPDLTTLGKIIGGGLPVGAYGGRADIMQQVMPAGPVFQAGTLSGNPLAVAGGLATLRRLKTHPPYERLEHLGARLEAGLRSACEEAGVPYQLNRVGSMMTLFFTGEQVESWDGASTSNTDRFGEYFWGLIDRGVYMPCSQYEALFISAAHTDEDIDTTIEAARETLGALQTA